MDDDNSLRALIKGAYDLLEFGHDPANGSWQIPPDAGSVHMAGSLLKDALEAFDKAPVMADSGAIPFRLIEDKTAMCYPSWGGDPYTQHDWRPSCDGSVCARCLISDR